MRIVMTGGGSGGHITPILAVAHEIKKVHPDYEISYIGQKGDPFADVVAANKLIDAVHVVSAGKFRRYHGEGLKQLLDIHTMGLNARDAARVAKGTAECYRLLSRLRPDVIFCKGGYVGVPVGLAATKLKIPFVTHDSDVLPGLANRVIGRWAKVHLVAHDPELYPYSIDSTVNVGVPVAPQYKPVTPELQAGYRKQAGLAGYDNVLLVTGGGLGALRLNKAVLHCIPELLKRYPKLAVIHNTGRADEAIVNTAYDSLLSSADRKRIKVYGYTNELATFSGAADIIVARGGATSLAELAAQGKACIVVPNPFLTGGHQLKNAIAYEEKEAVVVVEETHLGDNPELLLKAIQRLLDDPSKRKALGAQLHTFNRPDSAVEIAEIIIEVGKANPRV